MPRPERLPPLTPAMILNWADAHLARTGSWPRVRSGAIPGPEGLTWSDVNAALRNGERGLPGGDSLALLLARLRGKRKRPQRRGLSLKAIRDWARAHRRRTGKWPSASSGPIEDAPGESWNAINLALAQGHRGLAGGSSLAKLLGKRPPSRKKPLPS